MQYTKEELKKILSDHRDWLLDLGGKRAILSGADLSGADLSEADLLIFQFQQHTAYCTGEKLFIGCESHPVSEWLKNYEEIGKQSGYTPMQIKMYGMFIKTCAEYLKDGSVR